MAVLAVGLLGLSACGGGDDVVANDDCTPLPEDVSLVEDGKLTYSINATLPPVQFVEGDQVRGMRVELATMIAASLCLEPNPVNVPFDAQIPGVQGGRWDMINTGMFYTAERAETLTLVPYEVQAVAISVPVDAGGDIATESDLNGKRIGVEAPGYEFDSMETLNEKLRAEGGEGLDLNTSMTNADAFQALAAGQLDGVAIIESVTTHYAEGGRFETALDGIAPGVLAFGFAKDDTALAEAVGETFTDLVESGEVGELFEKYAVTLYEGPYEVSTGELTSGG
jgi:polar amino acid transport system substrate-binding protein